MQAKVPLEKKNGLVNKNNLCKYLKNYGKQ